MSAVGARCARMVIGLLTAVTAVVMTADPASAHARVVRTTPGSGAVTDGRLKVISVVFDDPVQVVPRSLVVTGATGAPQPIGAPRVVRGHTLQAPLSGRLPDGRYFVGWRILSDDGHIESGSFGFTVTAAAAGRASDASAAAGALPPKPAEPVWPVIVAAAMAAIACLGAGLVVVRGLAAVRSAGAIEPYLADDPATSAASTRDYTASRR